jgi:hypothetical protein
VTGFQKSAFGRRFLDKLSYLNEERQNSSLYTKFSVQSFALYQKSAQGGDTKQSKGCKQGIRPIGLKQGSKKRDKR